MTNAKQIFEALHMITAERKIFRAGERDSPCAINKLRGQVTSTRFWLKRAF